MKYYKSARCYLKPVILLLLARKVQAKAQQIGILSIAKMEGDLVGIIKFYLELEGMTREEAEKGGQNGN